MPTAAKTKTPAAKAPRKKSYPFTKHFKEWLAVRSQGKTLKAREELLKVGDDGEHGLKGAVMELGDEDTAGHFYIDLREPVEFQDETGQVFVYTGLKAEKRVSPKERVPDPELAEELLKDKGLWLTDVQLEQLRQIQMVNPYVTIDVVVDTDAVAAAYVKDVLTTKEYDSILGDQNVTFAFIPLVEK